MGDVLERDAGFCSGGDEYDIEGEDGIHSPTDASEDSVDVKVQAISLRNRNKRKCAEPRKLDSDLPAKKRKIDFTISKDVEPISCSPFRPWSSSFPSNYCDESSRFSSRISLPLKSVDDRTISDSLGKVKSELNVISLARLPSPQKVLPDTQSSNLRTKVEGSGSFPVLHQEEPLSLVYKKTDVDEDSKVPKNSKWSNEKDSDVSDIHLTVASPRWYALPEEANFPKLSTFVKSGSATENFVKKVSFENNVKSKNNKSSKVEAKKKQEDISTKIDNKFRIDSLLSTVRADGTSNLSITKSSQVGQQRNYKNMTRERRIEANARERTRVHTISAAFDTLRHSIPAYSHNQKLSKLSVLRIACSYIMTLSRLAGHDYSKDNSQPDMSHCVENVSKTIMIEGKIRKRKED